MEAIKFYRLFLWLLIVEKKQSFPAFSDSRERSGLAHERRLLLPRQARETSMRSQN